MRRYRFGGKPLLFVWCLEQNAGADKQIAEATDGPNWFRLYFKQDVSVPKSQFKLAQRAGYPVIVLTAEALGPGMPDSLRAMGTAFRSDMTFDNHDPTQGGSGHFLAQKTALTPDDIQMLKDETGLTVIVKGIRRAEDVNPIIATVADATQVSSHGGR